MFKNILRYFVYLLPRNAIIFRTCRRYINLYNSENNGEMQTNGELHLLQQVLPNCAVVFDVGANVGDWAALALGINSDLNIHCFEPSVATYQILKSRGLTGTLVLNNLGLGSIQGDRTLYVFADGAGTNSVYHREGINAVQSKTEQISLTTLDAYCQQAKVDQIDLLKLDVEGHELDVLKGSQSMLAQGQIKRIQFEYGGTYIDARILLKDLFDLLLPYGYKFYKIYPNSLHHEERYDQVLENFQYANWLAVKS
jgi:FkbM family methyltransferase